MYQGEIGAVQFFVLGEDDIRNISVVEVKTGKGTVVKSGETADLSDEAGLYDPRMGATSTDSCKTCGGRNECPGHYGHIELSYPVFSPMFMSEIVTWLNVVCYNCGKPPVGMPVLKKDNPFVEYRQKFTSSQVKKYANCQNPECGVPIRTYSQEKQKPTRITANYQVKVASQPQKKTIFAHEAREIFDKVDGDTLAYFGTSVLAHPRRYVNRAILVPPNPMRPSSGTSESDPRKNNSNFLVKKLQEIILENARIPIGTTTYTADILQKGDTLSKLYYAMVKGKSTTDADKQQVQSLSSKIGGKQGLIRATNMGKRVGGLARFVIICDCDLKQNEIGINFDIVTGISMPERVCKYNFDRMFQLYTNGETEYPGCLSIKKGGAGGSINITKYKNTPGAQLELGDVLDRNIMPGEKIAVSREPCISTSSSTSMTVRPCRGNACAMNVCSCNLFAADFDGDQMTLMRSNTPMAQAETEFISNYSARIVSMETGAPTNGQHQDSIMATFEMSRSSTRIGRESAYRLLSCLPGVPRFEQKTIFTGREVLSAIMKNLGIDLSVTSKGRFYNPNLAKFIDFDDSDKMVVIKNGIIQSGILDKSLLAIGEKGSLFHMTTHHYGPNASIDFSTYMQKIALSYIKEIGISISVRDVTVSSDAIDKVRDIIRGAVSESYNVSRDYYDGRVVAPIGKDTVEYYEQIQNNVLKVSNIDGSIDDYAFSSIPLMDNNLFKLIYSGSRGKPDNFRVIATSLSQLTIDGGRAPETYDGRSSIYYTRYSHDPCARGFVINSYRDGLNPREYFAHCRESRNQIVTRALTTAIAGTKSRRMVKNMENLVVDPLHRSVRRGAVVQLLYGEDGCDPSKDIVVPIMILDPMKSTEDVKSLVSANGNQTQVKKILKYRDQLIAETIKVCSVFRMAYSHYKALPFTLVQIMGSTKGKVIGDEDEEEAMRILDELVEELPRCYYNRHYKGKVCEHFEHSVKYMRAYLYSELNVAALKRADISIEYLSVIKYFVLYCVKSNMMGFGQPIGVIASQSLSNSLTQFVISAHHRSGVGSSETKSLGRINEISEIKSKEDIRSPAMIIGLKPEYATDKAKVIKIINEIRSVPISIFIKEVSGLIYGFFGSIAIPKYAPDNKEMKEYAKVRPPPKDIVNKCIRIVLDLEIMSQRQVSVNEIVDALVNTHDVYVTYLVRENNLLMYVWFTVRNKLDIKKYSKMVKLISSIRATTIKGIKDIKSAVDRERVRYTVSDDGSVKSHKEFVIETEGSDLAKILKLPYVDPAKTYCNVLEEIETVFGIEVARNMYITEYTEQLGEGINARHYNLLADEISYTGNLTGVSRKGNEERGATAMQLMSDEQALAAITSSATSALYDDIEGISPNILMSQVPRIGTNYTHVLVDEDYARSMATTSVNDELDAL